MTAGLSDRRPSAMHATMVRLWKSTVAFLSAFVLCPGLLIAPAAAQVSNQIVDGQVPAGMEVATFGGGCFWCVEAVFENVNGVVDVVSGYAGGTVPNPTYEQVCSKLTGHAEVCQITFDPKKISYLRLMEIFMKTHDPTKLNAQGPDHGPQYRSVIFYHDDEQKAQTEELISRLNEEKAYDGKIVTKVEPFSVFYRAEEYHQDFYRKNPGNAYCQMNARPKLSKLKKVMQELEKKEKKEKGKK